MQALARSLLAPLAALALSTAARGQKPNVVVFFADDFGWTDVSGTKTNRGNGSDYYKTPNIDALMARGLSFDNAYSCPNCAPTRAALMSGQYSTRNGCYTVNGGNRGQSRFRKLDSAANRTTLAASVVTLAETLRKAGYTNGQFGKWHLGNDSSNVGPISQGFDVNRGGTGRGSVSGGSSGHFAKNDGSWNLPGLGANQRSGQFIAERLTDETLAFMAANRAKPFFAYLSHFSVHTPIQAPTRDRNAFNNVPKGRRHRNQTYAAMIKNMDDQLGRIVRYLETTDDPRNQGKKLIANTVLVFLSDNGGLGGYASAGISGGQEITHQFPLKSGKGSLYEGGVRVPWIIRWDARYGAGRVVSAPVTTVDLYPTLTAIAGGSMPSGQVADGEDLTPILEGRKTNTQRASIYWHFPGYLQASSSRGTWRTTPVSVIRRGNYKAHFYYETRTWELYDVVADLGEARNLAVQRPDLVRMLGQDLRNWLVRTQAKLPLVKGTSREVPLPDLPQLSVNDVNWRAIAQSAPRPVADAAFVADTKNRRFLLFGGRSTVSLSDELWEFRSQAWRRLLPNGPRPSGRSGMAACYDEARGELVIVGGQTVAGPVAETWIYNGTSWRSFTGSRPAQIVGGGMCNDAQSKRCLFFGGHRQGVATNAMFAWNGTSWTSLSPATLPPPRSHHGLAWDTRRQRAVLFGGLGGAALPLNDTWVFDGTNWRDVSRVMRPLARQGAPLVYDSARDRCVLFGGQWVNSIRLNDTWEFDGNAWAERRPTTKPPLRSESAMLYDTRTARCVMLGGRGQAVLADSWSYGAERTAKVIAFGLGCAASTGPTPKTRADTLPWIGGDFELVARDLPANNPAVAFMVGASRGSWAFGALPFDLSPLGFRGCSLLVDPVWTFASPTAGGVARLRLALPNDRSLAGRRIFSQAFVPSVGANAGGALLSDGLDAQFGIR